MLVNHCISNYISELMHVTILRVMTIKKKNKNAFSKSVIIVEDYCEVISFVLKLSCLYFTRTSVPRNMCRFKLSNTFTDIRTMTSSHAITSY